jgi:pSer/pThr/pTyr-binding forkhead associated (FHA) protein
MTETRLDHFMESCGAAAPLEIQVLRQGQSGARNYVLDKPAILIGRAERNDLCLPDSLISRTHAYLQIVGGQLVCLDLGSRTGVYWAGKPKRWGWLSPDSPADIGPFALRLDPSLPDGSTRPPLEEWKPLGIGRHNQDLQAGWMFELCYGLPGRSRWQLNRVLTLFGASPQCKVRLSNVSVSRFHCSIVSTPRGVWVVDLFSRSGTYVNRQRVQYAQLSNGDYLQVGKVLFRVWHNPDKYPLPMGLFASLTGAPSSGVSLGRAESPTQAEDSLVAVDTLDQRGAPQDSASAVESPEPVAQLGEPAAPDVVVESGPSAMPPEPGQGSFLVPSGGAPTMSKSLLPAGDSQSPYAEMLLLPVITQFNSMQQQMFDQFQQTVLMMAQMFGTLQQDQMKLIRDELDQLHHLNRELHSLQTEIARTGGKAPNGRDGGTPLLAPKPPPVTSRFPGNRTNEPAPDKTARPGAAAPENIHTVLWERLNAIEQERKSHWQKIMEFMRGK